MSELAKIVVENAARSRLMLRLAARKSTTLAERHALWRASGQFENDARECAELVISRGVSAA